MSPFKKFFQSVMSTNIRIKWPSNIIRIRIRIRAISAIQIYSGIRSVNMLHPNIFIYSFGTYCGIRIYSDICLCPFYDIRSSLGPWVHFKVCWGSFQSESWFNWECNRAHLMCRQMNQGALSIEPRLTLKWTKGPYFWSWKNQKKINV